MIKLCGSRFTDLLPENLSSQTETQAMAYAVGRQVEKLCSMADGAMLFSAADTLPERTLDALALELRTPAYNEAYTLDVKRALVKDTLTFYAKMGTPYACNRIIEIIFKTGYVEKSDKPFCFRAYIGADGSVITPEALAEFRRVIESVKRKSAWLEDVIAIASFDPDILHAMGRMGRGYMKTPLREAPTDYHMKNTPIHGGGAFGTIADTTLPRA